MPAKRNSAGAVTAAPEIITTRQARALNEILEAFYADPKNRAAFVAWQRQQATAKA
jgi:hypothetical protein